MAILKFGVTTPSLPSAYDQCAFGTDGTAPNRFTDKEVNKAVKLGSADNYVLVADGDDLEAVVTNVQSGGDFVNGGYSYGTAQVRFKHLEAKVVAAGTTLVIGDQVICAPQAALGTAQDYPIIKKGVGAIFKWRVKSLPEGTGAAGKVVLLEPCTR